MTTGLTLYDEFAGVGGSTQGAAAVPDPRPVSEPELGEPTRVVGAYHATTDG